MGQRIGWLENAEVVNNEWIVADEEILIRARNYRIQLQSTWEKIRFDQIVNDIRTFYLDRDLKKYMVLKAYQNVNEILTEAENENDVEKVVKAYTMTNNFHELVNTHLANLVNTNNLHDIGLHPNAPFMTYWNGPLDLACIFVNHKELEKYRPKTNQIVFRGMTVAREVAETYRERTRLMNKTFVSTSKYRDVALFFLGEHPNLVTCLCVYTLKPGIRRTTLDISRMSAVESEGEILILPYSTFEVTKIIPLNDNGPDSIDFTIELEEYHPEIYD